MSSATCAPVEVQLCRHNHLLPNYRWHGASDSAPRSEVRFPHPYTTTVLMSSFCHFCSP